MNVLFDPEQKGMEPLKATASNGQKTLETVEAKDGIPKVKQCCKIVRDICKARSIREDMVPVVHRQKKNTFRYWDIRQGQAGATNYCEVLCGPEWRIASAEETAEFHKKQESDRAAAQDKATRETAAKVAVEAGIGHLIAAATNTTLVPQAAPTATPATIPEPTVPNPAPATNPAPTTHAHGTHKK